MQRSLDFMDDINLKYSKLECDLDFQLRKINQDEQTFDKMYAPKKVTFNDDQTNQKTKKCINLQMAKDRNMELIKDLEISKARLRSRATYSPLENVLNKAITNYLRNKSLEPSVLRKIYEPTFL